MNQSERILTVDEWEELRSQLRSLIRQYGEGEVDEALLGVMCELSHKGKSNKSEIAERAGMDLFNARYPGMIANVFEAINKVARVAPNGKHGIAFRTALENIAIAGIIAGERAIAESQAPQWISVEEGKLPEQRTWVIGCCEHDGKRMSVPVYGVRVSFDENRWRWESEFPVTHWMPMPQPPKGIENV